MGHCLLELAAVPYSKLHELPYTKLQHLSHTYWTNLAVATRTELKVSEQSRATMSSSIPIPASRNLNKQSAHTRRTSSTSSTSSYYPYHHNSASTPGSSYASSHHHYSPSSFSDSSKSGKGKGKEREVEAVVHSQPRRASLLGSSLSKSEHTVIDLGHGGAPRLVSCVKSSQGFDWNQELFLPSYADYESQNLERKQDPVQDIVLTEEEIAAMFPQ